MHGIFVIDFETTGTDVAAPGFAPLEMAAVFCSVRGGLEVRSEFESLMNPGVKIPAESSAVHHIVDSDVTEAPPPAEVFDSFWRYGARVMHELEIDQLASGIKPVFCAHNAEYEKSVLSRMKQPLHEDWICTYKCSLVEWPDAPSHKNEALRYLLRDDSVPRGRSGGQSPHSALHDCRVTAGLVNQLLRAGWTVERMVEVSSQPAQLPGPNFGKHRGQKWAEVPVGYLQWMLKQSDMNPDAVHCARMELARRC